MLSGSKILTEAKENRFFSKPTSKRELKESALIRLKMRAQKQKELY